MLAVVIAAICTELSCCNWVEVHPWSVLDDSAAISTVVIAVIAEVVMAPAGRMARWAAVMALICVLESPSICPADNAAMTEVLIAAMSLVSMDAIWVDVRPLMLFVVNDPICVDDIDTI